jgi:hypothetical protein
VLGEEGDLLGGSGRIGHATPYRYGAAMPATRSTLTVVLDPAYIDPALDARAATFENPTGAWGGGERRRPEGRRAGVSIATSGSCWPTWTGPASSATSG